VFRGLQYERKSNEVCGFFMRQLFFCLLNSTVPFSELFCFEKEARMQSSVLQNASRAISYRKWPAQLHGSLLEFLTALKSVQSF